MKTLRELLKLVLSWEFLDEPAMVRIVKRDENGIVRGHAMVPIKSVHCAETFAFRIEFSDIKWEVT